jgi:predicted lipid-binding transport protein (Tim44 family)
MLGGLAAGLGLAWLAHSLGLGAEFGQFLMFGLLALVIMVVVGMIMRRRAAPAQERSPYAFEGAGSAVDPQSVPQYNPKNVGNDASARPWEGQSASFEPAAAPAPAPTATRSGSMIGSALIGGHQNWTIPADFDVAGFVSAAKQNFISLQDAWDRSDIPALRVMMTDAMLAEIKTQLAEREAQNSGAPNKTEVVMLEAQLLGIEDLGEGYMASVEFSGMIREEPSAGPSPFREVWNMTRPKAGQVGWLVAGVQALQ